jgi:hypothetical protein
MGRRETKIILLSVFLETRGLTNCDNSLQSGSNKAKSDMDEWKRIKSGFFWKQSITSFDFENDNPF